MADLSAQISAMLTTPAKPAAPPPLQHAPTSLQSAMSSGDGDVISLVTLKELIEDNNMKIKDLFQAWDEDNNGKVSKTEFRRAILALGFDATREQINAVFDLLDRDGSGEMDYKELHIAIKGVPPKVVVKTKIKEKEPKEEKKTTSSKASSKDDGKKSTSSKASTTTKTSTKSAKEPAPKAPSPPPLPVVAIEDATANRLLAQSRQLKEEQRTHAEAEARNAEALSLLAQQQKVVVDTEARVEEEHRKYEEEHERLERLQLEKERAEQEAREAHEEALRIELEAQKAAEIERREAQV